MFDIKENLKKLPDKPGRLSSQGHKLGHVIYVGKAVSLKNRVPPVFSVADQYGTESAGLWWSISRNSNISRRTPRWRLSYWECNLIKKYMPKYNVLLRDDKTYPYIKVTTGEDFPRVLKTRRVVGDGSRYFGPYSDVGAVNEIIRSPQQCLSAEAVLRPVISEGFPSLSELSHRTVQRRLRGKSFKGRIRASDRKGAGPFLKGTESGDDRKR